MESLDLTDDEVRSELLRARKLAEVCRNHGLPQPASHYDSTARALRKEGEARGLDL